MFCHKIFKAEQKSHHFIDIIDYSHLFINNKKHNVSVSNQLILCVCGYWTNYKIH